MKITLTLSDGSASILKAYAAYKILGDTVEEVASFLLMSELRNIVASPGFLHLLNAVKEDEYARKAARLRKKK